MAKRNTSTRRRYSGASDVQAPKPVAPELESQLHRDDRSIPRKKEFKCFVIMPSGSGKEYEGGTAEAGYIYRDFISSAIEQVADEWDVSILTESAVETDATGNITDDIIDHLLHDHIVIADLTGHNPNVFLELGIRYARRRFGTIPIMQKGGDLPFDIKPQRTVFYSTRRWDSKDGHDRLKSAIREVVATLKTGMQKTTDSPVDRVEELQSKLNLPDDWMNPAQIIQDTWRLRSGSIAVVASSVATRDRILRKHYTHSTGSGQFYAIARLLPPLVIAYPSNQISMHLSEQLNQDKWNDLNRSDLVLLGGATNKWTKQIINRLKEELPFKYQVPMKATEGFSTVTRKSDGKPWEVKDEDDEIKEDFGVVVWTRLPREKSRRILIAFGGATYGTEAAVRFAVNPQSQYEAMRNLAPDDGIAFAVKTKVEQHRLGSAIGEPEILGKFWVGPPER